MANRVVEAANLAGRRPAARRRLLCEAYPPVAAGDRAAGPDPKPSFGIANPPPKSSRSSGDRHPPKAQVPQSAFGIE